MNNLDKAIELLRNVRNDASTNKLTDEIDAFLASMDKVLVKIVRDEFPENPRVYNINVGTMFCRHSRYDLGDKGAKDPYETDDNGERSLRSDVAVCLPIYMYDHSGITISTKSFNCPWDSGQVGVIYATKETVAREWNGDIEKAKACLEAEVETYDQFLTGDVYGFVINTGAGVEIDSGWSFYGRTLEETRILDSVIPKYHDALRKAWEKM